MRDDENRVTVALWNIIKPCLMMKTDDGLAPTFGDVVDRFRIMWHVYISVTPSTNDGVLINRYRYEVFRLSGNDIKDQFLGSDQAYYQAMRKAILKAYEFVSALDQKPKT